MRISDWSSDVCSSDLRTVLFTTRGFRDALRIGYQELPRLFDLRIVLSELLYERIDEGDERVDAQGKVLQAPDEDEIRRQLQDAYAAGFRSIAIVLMHAYRYPAHENQIAALAREAGFTQVSVSHEVSPMMKLVGRGDTTVVDAYLSPILRRYRSEEHTSELQSLMRISYAVFCLKKK